MKFLITPAKVSGSMSPPSRGAWIEIGIVSTVASAVTSPPSRGAWIEIPKALPQKPVLIVAPLAGGVD